MTVRLRIDLAYDGAPFYGFARQRDRVTVQGTLEGALSRVLGVEVATTCAGRTDRGVHATAQVVHVDVDLETGAARRGVADLAILRDRLDHMVGVAISIWSVTQTDDAFDARFSALERRYRYRLCDAKACDPLRRFDRWHVGEPLRLRAMQQAAKFLVGEHDFASFCRKADGRTTVRRIDEVAVARRAPGEIHVRLRGPAFCHQQVRSIVGCLVEIGRGRQDPAWLGSVLAARDRSVAARVAPAHGLTLEAVRYPRPYLHAPPVPLAPHA